MVPKRAMRINIMTGYFRRDAEIFHQWQLPIGAEARCRASAALLSLLFAGTAAGIPSGRHKEKGDDVSLQSDGSGGGPSGAGRKVTKPVGVYNRYVFAPHHNLSETWPMFQVGLEDIYNSDETDVVAIGVWLFVSAATPCTLPLAPFPLIAKAS
jgi:hypothetical protein